MEIPEATEEQKELFFRDVKICQTTLAGIIKGWRKQGRTDGAICKALYQEFVWFVACTNIADELAEILLKDFPRAFADAKKIVEECKESKHV